MPLPARNCSHFSVPRMASRRIVQSEGSHLALRARELRQAVGVSSKRGSRESGVSQTGSDCYPFRDEIIVAFSPDGKSIAASSQTGTEMGICDATTGQVLLSLPHGSRWAVAFSRDGRLLAERAGRAAGLFDVARGQWLVTVPIQSLYGGALSLSPDGRRIVSGGRDGALKVWDTDTGHELLVLHGHEDIITTSHSATTVARSLPPAGMVRSRSGRQLLTINLGSRTRCCT